MHRFYNSFWQILQVLDIRPESALVPLGAANGESGAKEPKIGHPDAARLARGDPFTENGREDVP